VHFTHPGYGCGSIDNYAKSYNGKLMDEWLKTVTP
jgi:hypothetical protein